MASLRGFFEAVLDSDLPLGDDSLAVAIGPWRFVLEGADTDSSRSLATRWGGFVERPDPDAPALTIAIQSSRRERFLDPVPGEVYRVEGGVVEGGPLLVSYHFVAARESETAWRLALSSSVDEPRDRTVENALRGIVARLAIEAGGIALHGAGVARRSRAHVFAGPSGAGKTTAVRATAPSESLGDDFAVALPEAGGWVTIAVPFDNAEEGPARPRRGTIPLAGIWKLFKADRPRVETPDSLRAAASLLSCAAIPSAMPDLATRLVEAAARYVTEGRFGHLYFRRGDDIWTIVERGAPSG